MRRILTLILSLSYSSLLFANVPTITISSGTYSEKSLLYPIEKYIFKSYSRLGYRVNIIELSVGRSIKMAENGEIDALMIKAEEVANSLNNLIKVPILLLEGEFMLYCQAHVDCDFSVLNDPEIIVGVLSGVNLPTQYLSTKSASMYQISKGSQLAEVFKKKRIDYILTFEIDGINVFDFNLANDIQKLPIKKVKGYHLVHKKHQKLIPEIKASIEQTIKELGPISDNIERYFNENTSVQ
ncbi:hypothetical protein HII17_12670 [Thalassotalea sp. M1531]|uniref:Solute-binding protein family 3/N-terminal domain-containing protein n=1 Tax=Thalassotalea algicola TaxID=2716224 RepID=A0A7Y0Q7Z2_9GAMM|nr:hypothetical protein [Thalassotalea algicola]NMP32417.1 hypothetical protein [Thalassotalea algicola]